MGKTIKQILRSYSLNRRSTSPMQLHITNFNGAAVKEMSKHDGYKNWDLNFHSTSYLDQFPTDKLVYLTSESDNVIEALDADKIYIIGGFVDHNAHKVRITIYKGELLCRTLPFLYSALSSRFKSS